jgi:hypothetical protein
MLQGPMKLTSGTSPWMLAAMEHSVISTTCFGLRLVM